MRVTPIPGVLSTLVVARFLGQGTLETELSPGDFAGPVAVEGLAELRGTTVPVEVSQVYVLR